MSNPPSELIPTILALLMKATVRGQWDLRAHLGLAFPARAPACTPSQEGPGDVGAGAELGEGDGE